MNIKFVAERTYTTKIVIKIVKFDHNFIDSAEDTGFEIPALVWSAYEKWGEFLQYSWNLF